MKKLYYFLILLIFLILSGCFSSVPDKAYHKIICLDGNNCSDELDKIIKKKENVFIGDRGFNACILDKDYKENGDYLYKKNYCNEEKLKDKIKTPYYEAWLEYNTTGKHQDENQLKAIVKWMNSSKKPLLVIIYIHGWHHNADNSGNNPRNNAIKFPFLMARSVDTIKRLELENQIKEHNVLGIYVGWQGEKYTDFIPSTYSIGSRSEVADRIGKEGILKKDLQKISLALNKRGGHMMVIGHSLGGRMLTSTFKSDLEKNTSFPLGENSLVVTINPAVDAGCYDNIFNKKSGFNPEVPRPYWINITSKDDFATKTIYRKARTCGLIKKCDKTSLDSKNTIGHYDKYINLNIDEANFDTNRNFREYRNYEMDWFLKLNRRVKMAFPSRNNNINKEKIFYSLHFHLHENRPFKSKVRVWNVQTDESIIAFADSDTDSKGLIFKIRHFKDKISGYHNAYISTPLTRLLIELLFYDRKKLSS